MSRTLSWQKKSNIEDKTTQEIHKVCSLEKGLPMKGAPGGSGDGLTVLLIVVVAEHLLKESSCMLGCGAFRLFVMAIVAKERLASVLQRFPEMNWKLADWPEKNVQMCAGENITAGEPHTSTSLRGPDWSTNLQGPDWRGSNNSPAPERNRGVNGMGLGVSWSNLWEE